tara:strand:- start:724 stop:1140 length:417 start_codon:yes stop_codon:yes gene_type:complete
MNFTGEKIRQLREARGWSQEDLAIKTHQSRETVGNHERGGKIPGTKQKMYKRIFGNLNKESDVTSFLQETKEKYNTSQPKLSQFTKMDIIHYIENDQDGFLELPEFKKMVSHLYKKEYLSEITNQLNQIKKEINKLKK